MTERTTDELAAALAPLVDLLADAVADRVVDREPEDRRSPWLTSAEAAERVRLSLDGLHRLTAAGAIPHVKQGGRLLFHADELDDWLRLHHAGPRREPVTKPFPRTQKSP